MITAMSVERVVLVAAVLASASLLPATVAHADAKLDEIRARGRLVVSVKNDAKRVHKDPAHQQKRGFEVELARALARRIVGDENKVELRILSRPTRLPMLGAGAVDMVISMIPVSAENEKLYDLSHPYFVSGVSLMARQDATAAGVADLEGKTVAVLKQSFNNYGAELQHIAEERGLHLTTRYYPTFAAAAAAVTSGEAAAMVSSLVDFDAFMKDHPGYKLIGKNEPRSCAVAVRKGDAALLKLVNETIDELKKSGALKRMTEKWKLPYLLPAS